MLVPPYVLDSIFLFFILLLFVCVRACYFFFFFWSEQNGNGTEIATVFIGLFISLKIFHIQIYGQQTKPAEKKSIANKKSIYHFNSASSLNVPVKLWLVYVFVALTRARVCV